MRSARLVAVAVLGGLLSRAAWAQDPGLAPPVIGFPLEILRTPRRFGKTQQAKLSTDFRRSLARVAVTPDAATVESALAQLKRNDCDRDDECLAQLAGYARTLYALYASVDLSLDGQRLTAVGRVVRDDGRLVAGPTRLELVKGNESFESVARLALDRLLQQLLVTSRLPAHRPAAPVVRAPAVVEPPPPPPPVVESVQPPPPAPPVAMTVNPLRPAGWIAAGVGGASAISGLVVFLTAPRLAKDPLGNVVDPAQFLAVTTQERVGVGLLIAGAAVAAGGVITGLLATDRPVAVSIGTTGTSHALVVSGSF